MRIEERSKKEYIVYGNNSKIGTIEQDEYGDWLLHPCYFFTSKRLGKGLNLKEIAEFLIKLNHKKLKKKQN